MPSSNTPFTVVGDLAKIEEHPTFAELDWTAVYPSRPDRVITRFSDKAEAQALFDAMTGAGLQVWKNWLA